MKIPSHNFRYLLLITLLGMIAGFSGCTSFPVYEYIGDLGPTRLDNGLYDSISLEIDNEIGNVFVQSINNADYFMDILIEVYSRDVNKYPLEEAEELSYDITGSTVGVSFIANPDNIGIPPYKYNLTIILNTNITVAIDIEDSTGDLEIRLHSSLLSDINLETSTGSSLLELAECVIDDTTPTVVASTGNLDIIMTDTNLTIPTAWTFDASTGKINIAMLFTVSLVNGRHNFDITTSTGSIKVDYTSNDNYGVKITTSVSTGTVSIPGGGTTYETDNYNVASIKFDFSLSTSTGDITFNKL